jgi:hypothetical protein
MIQHLLKIITSKSFLLNTFTFLLRNKLDRGKTISVFLLILFTLFQISVSAQINKTIKNLIEVKLSLTL